MWSAVAQWVAAVALGAGFAAYQIAQARASAKAQATFRYLERFTSERMRRIIKRSSDLYELNPLREQPIAAAGRRVKMTKEEARSRYLSASLSDKLDLDELFDLYEEVSAVYLRGLLDDAIFVDQIGPLLIVDWRLAHWLINDTRRLDDGSLDVDVYGNWQKVYRRMIARGIPHDEVDDSDSQAGDYDMLPDPPPRLWPDRIRWTGFRPPP